MKYKIVFQTYVIEKTPAYCNKNMSLNLEQKQKLALFFAFRMLPLGVATRHSEFIETQPSQQGQERHLV